MCAGLCPTYRTTFGIAEKNWLVEYGLTYHQTHYTCSSYQGRYLHAGGKTQQQLIWKITKHTKLNLTKLMPSLGAYYHLARKWIGPIQLLILGQSDKHPYP